MGGVNVSNSQRVRLGKSKKQLKRKRLIGIVAMIVGLAVTVWGGKTAYEAQQEMGRLNEMIMK